MRVRRSAFLLGGVALVALLGAAAPAFAVTDPSCDGSPYNNDPVIHDFAIATPDSPVEHAVSAVEGSGLVCGTDTTNTNTFYDSANVLTPPGVEVNGTAGIATGRFVGTAVVNVAHNLLGILQNQASVTTIEPVLSCQNETVVGGHIPGTITACYKGSNALGYNYNWVTVGKGGRSWLTIGRFHPIIGIAGLTHIKQFNLCAYVGAVGGSQYPADCGNSSQPWLQKNGDAVLALSGHQGGQGGPQGIGPGDTQDSCYDKRNGIYTVTATMRNGYATPAAKARVDWVSRSNSPCPPEPPNSTRPTR